jgi:tRNA 2-thiouridine synthesizing protein A
MIHKLDVRRLLCPIPVIRTQNRVKTLQQGDELEVLATDPGVLNDVPTWCRINGHEVLETGRRGREVYVRLKVGNQEDALI